MLRRRSDACADRRSVAALAAPFVAVLVSLAWIASARAQSPAPAPVPQPTGEADAAAPPSHPAAPEVDSPPGDAPPPPAPGEGGDAADTDERPPQSPPAAQPEASTPEPPPSYRLPAPPTGARYPGMDDLRSGSPFVGEDGELRLPIRISTRLRVLSTDLEALSSEGGSSTANGVLSMVTGGLVLALGALTEDESFSTFLYVFGTATILRGGVDMVVTPNASEPALQYSHMPMRDIAEVQQRLRYGERGLTSLADGFRLARILDGSISLAAGVLTIPLVLAPKDFKFEQTFDIFVVIGAGISILSGIVSLLTESEAERRDAAYRKLRRKLSRPPGKASGDVAIGVSTGQDAAVLHIRGRF